MKKLILILIISLVWNNSHSQNGFCLSALPDSPFGAYGNNSAIAKGDFNNDGQMDICVETIAPSGTTASGAVAILLSNGTGSYTAFNTVSITFLRWVSVLKANDFNNDGNEDIIAICGNCDSLFVLLGTGTGNFSVGVFSLNFTPLNIETADFNNDGKKDIAIANSMNAISISLGSGTGSFSSATNYTLNGTPSLLVPGDFNNNGAVDLFVLCNTSTYFLKGSGNGTFSVTSSFSLSADDIIATNVNADNKLDFVYTNMSNNQVSILKGNGNFTFSTALSYSVSGLNSNGSLGWVSSADFNNDGKMDLVTLASNSISILPGTGAGTFLSPVTYSFNTYLSYFIVVDMNNDNRPDIACIEWGGPTPYGPFDFFLNCNTVEVGLNEAFKLENAFSLFPNPAQTILNIQLSSINNNEYINLKIIDVTGKEIKNEAIKVTDTRAKISLDDINDGVYILQLKTDSEGLISKRFVISK